MYRRARPWASSVHTVLRYLEHRGVTCVPRVAGTGFSPDGFETLTYIEGGAVPPTSLTKKRRVRTRRTLAYDSRRATAIPSTA